MPEYIISDLLFIKILKNFIQTHNAFLTNFTAVSEILLNGSLKILILAEFLTDRCLIFDSKLCETLKKKNESNFLTGTYDSSRLQWVVKRVWNFKLSLYQPFVPRPWSFYLADINSFRSILVKDKFIANKISKWFLLYLKFLFLSNNKINNSIHS